MSDSLRDQLLKAGFSKPKAEPPKAKQRKSIHKKRPQPHKKGADPAAQQRAKSTSASTKQATNDEAIAQRKALKAQIKTLIDTNAIKEYKGEVVYRFTLQNRIRELHVNEQIHKQLIADEVAITRLNGSTYLVPSQTAKAINELNPDWAIVIPTEATSDKSDEYDAFPVPDDLQW